MVVVRSEAMNGGCPVLTHCGADLYNKYAIYNFNILDLDKTC